MKVSRYQASLIFTCRQIYSDLKDDFYNRLPLHLQAETSPSTPPAHLDDLSGDLDFLRGLISNPQLATLFLQAVPIYSPGSLISSWHYFVEDALPALEKLVFVEQTTGLL